MVKTILLLLPGAFSGVGGIEMFNRQIIRAFLELGHERGFSVRTLVMNDSTADVDDRYIPRNSMPPRGFSRNKWAFGSSALWNALRTEPDLVVLGHVHFARIAPLLRALSPKSRHWYLAYGIEVWQTLPASVRRGLALAEKVLSISDYSRKALVKSGGVPVERIGLLPCSLDPVWQAQYAPRAEEPVRPSNGPATLLTVARLTASERYKGVDSVIRALPRVLTEIPDIVYEVVGDGDDRPRLEAIARDMGVANHVRFRGRLWPDELATAYRDCALFVMPSSKEGFGIVFLEAALFGKPSIAGLQGGSPEVVTDEVTGVLVDREDADNLARTLVRLLRTHDARNRMGDAARRRLADVFTYASFRRNLFCQLAGSAAHLERP